MKVKVRGKDVICRAKLLYTLADLPAKAALTNMMQYIGRFGCPTCKQEGEQVTINVDSTGYSTLIVLHNVLQEHFITCLCHYSIRIILLYVKGWPTLY